MSLKSKLSSVLTLAFAVVAFTAYASAQDLAKPQEDGARKSERGYRHGGERGGRGMHGGHRGGMYGLRGIELTDAQKEQLRLIHEANKPDEATMAELKTIREARKSGTELTDAQKERVRAIKDQMQSKRESTKAQVMGILTPEQKQQLETQKLEREKHRQEMRQHRDEYRQKRDAEKSTDKPTSN
ncbi:MAG TPA: Spy/CpxP family protein refolding chaperone [Pyrinomonadaceae bacterium]|nr:Spy/CpxP family protein refolding chaperone [Pyrinomonadaceae bacterium]